MGSSGGGRSGGGGSSSGGSSGKVDYPSYMKTTHEAWLNEVDDDFSEAVTLNPYLDATAYNPDAVLLVLNDRLDNLDDLADYLEATDPWSEYVATATTLIEKNFDPDLRAHGETIRYKLSKANKFLERLWNYGLSLSPIDDWGAGIQKGKDLADDLFDHPVCRLAQSRILMNQFFGFTAGQFQYIDLGNRIRKFQLVQAVLMPAEIMPGPADQQVLFGDLEPVGRRTNGLEPCLGLLGHGIGHEQA